MRCAILGFVLGAACLQTCANLPGKAVMLGCAGAALAILLALHGPLRAACAGALLGFAWAALFAHVALGEQLAKDDEGRDLTLVGTIDSLPYRFEQGVRFNFKVEQVLAPGKAVVPPRVALSW